MRRRFATIEDSDQQSTRLTFKMPPSDPDFPFEIVALECIMTVPMAWPHSGKPSLRVTNKEMKRGFQLNVERGFDQIVAMAPKATLLGLVNRLDKDLEALLTGQMADTIKIVANARAPEAPKTTALPTRPAVQAEPLGTFEAVERFTPQQKEEAQSKRQADIRQLVARLGRLANFKQSADGVAFTVPFQPVKKDGIPDSIRNQSTIRLIVPELYNLHPCRIEIAGNDDPKARNIELSFKERAIAEKQATLMTHINYLSQHSAAMSVPKAGSAHVEPVELLKDDIAQIVEPITTASYDNQAIDNDKPHVKFIPRPPEFVAGNNEGEEDDWSSDASLTYDSGDDTEDESAEEGGDVSSAPVLSSAERGIMLSFPQMETHGIELLELTSLNIIVKCERCKDTTDVLRLRNNTTGEHVGMKDESCKKCANSLAVGYRADLMHANSVRAGYIDLDGCTIVDMLPRYVQHHKYDQKVNLTICSNFVPTCSECSNSYPAPGIVAVRGDSSMAICRECHHKMSESPCLEFMLILAGY